MQVIKKWVFREKWTGERRGKVSLSLFLPLFLRPQNPTRQILNVNWLINLFLQQCEANKSLCHKCKIKNEFCIKCHAGSYFSGSFRWLGRGMCMRGRGEERAQDSSIHKINGSGPFPSSRVELGPGPSLTLPFSPCPTSCLYRYSSFYAALPKNIWIQLCFRTFNETRNNITLFGLDIYS